MNKIMKEIKAKKTKGFTLIEMVIVIAIIAILILLIVPGLSKEKDKASNKTDEAFRATLQTQVELSENSKNASLGSLVEENLITEKQKQEAEQKHITITDGEVKLPKK